MEKRFVPTWESVRSHTLPAWYDDCKLGIFIHWGAYSVPAYASGKLEFGTVPLDENWFCNLPYTEWYFNSINIKKGPAYERHIKTYGEGFHYEQFAHMWRAENWSPGKWAELFRDAGAGYVVLTTKHHDGLCLFDSKYSGYNTLNLGPGRDIMGELTDAVRKAGMQMGAYYSGIIDWKHAPIPIYNNTEVYTNVPVSYAYADYAYNQLMELIDQYRPAILWNDIGWPKAGEARLPSLLAYYYNNIPDGLINDRWNGLAQDFITKEYKHGEASATMKWELCRGLGLSFGYNAYEDPKHQMPPKDLIRLLIHTVAGNGNLLINVGPRADGTIPEQQAACLLEMGRWLKINGDAIYGTQPGKEGDKELPGGVKACFTIKGNKRFMLLTDVPGPGAVEYTFPCVYTGLKPLDDTVQICTDGVHATITKRSSSNLAFEICGE